MKKIINTRAFITLFLPHRITSEAQLEEIEEINKEEQWHRDKQLKRSKQGVGEDHEIKGKVKSATRWAICNTVIDLSYVIDPQFNDVQHSTSIL